jgi:uncharacterized repeat protein (TIGR04138 family)
LSSNCFTLATYLPGDYAMTSLKSRPERRTYHPQAYHFVFAALRHTQETLGRDSRSEQSGHISGPELLEGVRTLGLQHYGMLAVSVFRSWGILGTEDFGRVVFELIESGEMRKTEDDRLDDFVEVYDFEKAFRENYIPDTSEAFRQVD